MTAAYPTLILASASPRRLDLLTAAGIRCQVVPVYVDEAPLPGEAPASLVKRLARAKAQAATAPPSAVVLGADTIVYCDGQVLNKPADAAAARAMLTHLSGRTHEVYTGVCLRRREPPREVLWHAITRVTFHSLTPAAIDAYLAVAAPYDKAGAYAIQEHGATLVARYDGLLSTVIGLPVEEVVARLAAFA